MSKESDDHVEQARAIITAPRNQPVRLTLITLVELVWVLNKLKRWAYADVFALCNRLLLSPDFEVEDPALVQQCLRDADQAGCDLADALIAQNQRAGCQTMITFDRDAQRLAGMTPAETLT